MKTNLPSFLSRSDRALLAGGTFAGILGTVAFPIHADETCLSPYMKKITGQEDYVWTLGAEGIGDEQDKL